MAYRSGTKIGSYNYKSKSSEILFSHIFLPADNDAVDREKLWTDCFASEKNQMQNGAVNLLSLFLKK